MDALQRMTLAAPAKINLFLEVLGRRPDGYHEIVTCMTPLALADELTFVPADQLTLTCDDPSLPLDEQNLVLRAARALQRHSGTTRGAAIHLTKRVPHAAGLGGGSSDAATTLRGLNQLWHTQRSDAELMTLAATLGSDVPFFLANATAWCHGRGEQIEPIRSTAKLHLLLICPMIGLSTAAVYASLSPGGGGLGWGGEATRPSAAKSQGGDPSPPAPLPQGERGASPLLPGARGDMQEALERGDAERVGRALFNRLQAPAERLLPLIAEVRQLLESLASEELFWGHQMSGSGSSYFVVCRGEAEAQRLARLVFTRWVGGVLFTGMGTTQPPDAPTERTLRLFVTSSA